MKFKEKRGNVFVFDGGYAGGELELFELEDDWYRLADADLDIRKDFAIRHDAHDYAYQKDIQTAVNLMQILIEEGLV
jgi:hypothetical protein